jgi:hypothetical protein
MTVEDNLLPGELSERIFTMDREEFRRSLETDVVLLARLDGDPSVRSSFERALVEPTRTKTAIMKLSSAELAAATARAALQTPDGVRSILEAPHWAMPLRKRVEATEGDAERISVGRSHACDVVLFHPSVSKLHAWLEHDENDRVFVSDAGSMNLTRMRGRTLVAEELVNVELCEEIRFGEVVVRVCTPGLLWDALRT